MMKLVGWAQSIVTFRAVHLRILMVSPLYSAFIWCWNDHLPALPVHPTGACLERAFEYFTRRYQIVRSRR